MSIVKCLSVGNGDMTYIRHNSDNFTIVDCCLSDENQEDIIKQIKRESKEKSIKRFISTHPDHDHIAGLHHLDDAIGIVNFYVVKNKAIKEDKTDSFDRYCELRDGEHSFYVYKGCSRRWMNEGNEERGSAGISILWPDTKNEHFKQALAEAEEGIAYNNMSLVARYSLNGGVNMMWLGDLETQFMKDIENSISLPKTEIILAAHHGRKTGKIPNTWLEKIQPEIIILGEAPSREMEYYTGYNTLTQNRCGDITMDCRDGEVDIYVSSETYGKRDWLRDKGRNRFPNYIGTLDI